MTGPWTFTSPSVYLAFGTIGAYAKCRPPSQPFTDSVIALDPSELSSVVYTIDFATMLCSTCIRGLKFYQEQTKLFDIRDLNGPPPATAYFNAANGANYARDNFYYGPSSEDFFAGSSNMESVNALRKSVDTITEGNYFPVVAIPTKALKDPSFKGCNPLKALDPPVVFSALRTIQMPNIPTFPTASPGSVETALQPTPTDDVLSASGRSDPVGASRRPGYDNDAPRLQPGSAFSLPSGLPLGDPLAVGVPAATPAVPPAPPTTIFTIGQTAVTASAIPDPQRVLVGSNILSVGGPAEVIAGETVSLASDGSLHIGPDRVIQIPKAATGTNQPPSTIVLQVGGRPITATKRVNSNGQAEVLIGGATLRPGGSVVDVDGKTLSLDGSGNVMEGGTAIQTLSSRTLSSIDTSKTSVGWYEPSNRNPYTPIPTSASRKKSGATRSVEVSAGLLGFCLLSLCLM